ncbi:NAD(P)/FAD-dependent oxidoreductase [Streptomyces profundus]|uniref:NAD(P)/FAD-dependent oxidoreductase n=1 Tax=Streptomyces profundus TaxID=2867410 RepID=UPI001D16DD34|nr:tryptophan 7-halogenase [Streptomyces sp. MA3_2.13]UED88036.1 tryptophan 7-halogenase [Streptomyces sp. MA3_2.13]
MNTTDNRSRDTGRHDVIVLGAGMAGGALASVLARNGVRVLVIDAGVHPRFAVGESTIPYTSSMIKLIATRYGVPEITPLASFRGIQRKISPMSGRKQHFGFVYHREGKPQDPSQANQLSIPGWHSTESHLFRQDTDAYLYHLAIGYGAQGRLATRVQDIETGPDGVVVRSDQGEEFHGAYLVDGSGFRSPVAERFGLREEPTRARHHSRSLFTHMVGVKPFDDCEAGGGHQQPNPWHHGTLHHVFDGGWLWVIPFDNHEGAVSTLCSVGLTVDERVFPKPDDVPPQEEFETFLARFPQIAEQFTRARAVRPWVGTGRLQYSATRTVGERYCLTAHAAGFIDALYSRGLNNTFEVVNALAWRLIEASRDGDWSTERFAPVDRLQQDLFDVHDDLVYSSFVGFRDYGLWNAVSRVWKSISVMPALALDRAARIFRETGDDQVLRDLEQSDPAGLPAPVNRDLCALLTFTRELCQRVEAGEVTPGDAAPRILERVGNTPAIPPAFDLANPDNRFFESTPDLMQQASEWGRSESPEHIRSVFGH